MILILSEQNEVSTDNTIEWLLSKNKKIVRFNTETPCQLEKIILFLKIFQPSINIGDETFVKYFLYKSKISFEIGKYLCIFASLNGIKF